MVTTKLRSTTLKRNKPRKRITRLKPVEYITSTEPQTKTRIIPIPIIVGKITKLKVPKIKAIKPPTKPPIIKIPGGGDTPGSGKKIGPLQGGPVKSSVAAAVWYWARSMLMVIDFHGGAQYEYYQTQFDLFNYIYNGMGTAISDGENQYGKWWKGKSNPSVGASIRRKLQAGMADFKRVK